MDAEQHIWDRKKVGLEMRQKYELYFATLIFTLLGLAIQTADAPTSKCVYLLEMLSWACFMFAGLISLWRLNKIWFREFRVGEYYEAKWVPGDEHKAIYKELIGLDTILERTEWCRWGLFVLATACVAVARALALV